MSVGGGGNPCNMTCLCVACGQEVSAKPKASLLFPPPAWELGPAIEEFQNRNDHFLTECFMVCLFPTCCSYAIEAGKYSCKFPFNWLLLAVKNLKDCSLCLPPLHPSKNLLPPLYFRLTVLGFRTLQHIFLLVTLQQSSVKPQCLLVLSDFSILRAKCHNSQSF